MPKFLITLGILLIVGSFIAPMATSFGGLKIPGLQSPTAAVLCRPGETLETKSGGSARIAGSNTYAHSVQYVCVDQQGNRRDATGDFVNNLGGETMSFIQNIFGAAMITTVASLAGTALLVVGIIMSVRRGIASGKLRVVTPVYADITDQMKGTLLGAKSSSSAAGAKSSDAATRLQQLEGMYRSRLISEDEYQAKRKEILQQL